MVLFLSFLSRVRIYRNVFFIKGDIGVYINNGSLTIYIFIDIRITYRSHDAKNAIYLSLGQRTKRTIIRLERLMLEALNGDLKIHIKI